MHHKTLRNLLIIFRHIIIIIIIIIMRVIYIAPKNVKQTHRRSHCTSAKRMTSILRHVASAFPPARQRTILNSDRGIGIATNTSMVLNCALVIGCSFTSYPGRRYKHMKLLIIINIIDINK